MSTTLRISALVLAVSGAAAQSPAPGLRLYTPFVGTDTYLVDTNDQIVHTWTDTLTSSASVYLEPDGTLLRTIFVPGGPTAGGATGGLRRLALDGTVEWDFRWSDATRWSHHDVEVLPNGNVLLVAWERLTAADAIAAGRNPLLLGTNDWLPDKVVEIQQTGPTTGTVVWEWRVMDHLIQDFDPTRPDFGVVADHPERLDVNYPPSILEDGEFNHINAIDYDPVRDVIALCTPFQNEVWVIDHSTTTAEAAGSTGGNFGKGGDILYRWGNPQAYRRGGPADQKLFFQHSAQFVAQGRPGAGNILVFNNRAGAPLHGGYSSVVEFTPPPNFALTPGQPYGPAAPVWEYTAPVPTDFYSYIVSSAERLPNGNTLVCSGFQNGHMFEVDPGGTRVWDYVPNLPPPRIVFQSIYVGDQMLWQDADEISLSTGGTVTFDLIAGSPHAGRTYLMLGSAAGTSPGLPLGSLTLPLNFDGYMSAMLTTPNVYPWGATAGTLDPLGRAQATFSLPGNLLPPEAAGVVLHHAFVIYDVGLVSPDRTSNALPVTWVP